MLLCFENAGYRILEMLSITFYNQQFDVVLVFTMEDVAPVNPVIMVYLMVIFKGHMYDQRFNRLIFASFENWRF